MRPTQKPTILLNAMHTTTGGGLVYLAHLLPHLAEDTRFRFILLLHPQALGHIPVPAQMDLRHAPALPFGLSHAWEQLILPLRARLWGAQAVWNNANYGPLLAPRSMVTIHTTPLAAAAWPGLRAKVYWALVKLLTRLSLWRAPVAFTVARHVIGHYVGPRTAAKIKVTPPAVNLHAHFGLTRTPHQLIAVGDVYSQKQYPFLLGVLARLRTQLPTATLLLIGRPVQPAAVKELEAALKHHKLQKAVTWMKGAPHAQVMQHLAQAGAFINASSAECFNMPVLEAMSVGTPCILPNTTFQQEVAGDAAAYVPVDKGGDLEAAFAVAALAVLTNESIATMLSRKGLQQAQQFTWQATAKTLLTTFATLLKV